MCLLDKSSKKIYFKCLAGHGSLSRAIVCELPDHIQVLRLFWDEDDLTLIRSGFFPDLKVRGGGQICPPSRNNKQTSFTKFSNHHLVIIGVYGLCAKYWVVRT